MPTGPAVGCQYSQCICASVAPWLALESTIDFDILHTPRYPEADRYCHTARSREVLGLEDGSLFPDE